MGAEPKAYYRGISAGRGWSLLNGYSLGAHPTLTALLVLPSPHLPKSDSQAAGNQVAEVLWQTAVFIDYINRDWLSASTCDVCRNTRITAVLLTFGITAVGHEMCFHTE